LLALACAQHSTSLMDDWADAPQALEDFAPDADVVVSSAPTLAPHLWQQPEREPRALVA
jgi:hypothetical protein